MVGVVGGNALAGPTAAELAQRGASNFGQSAQSLAQLMEQRHQQDQKTATEQITKMAEGIPGGLPVFLKTKEGKEAVMAFAPKLFRGLNAKKKAEQWLAAYDAAPMSTEQLRQADEYFKVTGMMTPQTETQLGSSADWQSLLPASMEQAAPMPTPAQAPTQPVTQAVKPPSAAPEANLDAAFANTKSRFVTMKPVSVKNDGSMEVRSQPDPTTTQRFVVTDPLTGKPGQYPDGSLMVFDTADRAEQAYKGLLFKMNEQRAGYGGQYKTIVDSIFSPPATESDKMREQIAQERAKNDAARTGGTSSNTTTPSNITLRSDMSAREFLLAKKAAGFNIDVNPQGTTPDAQLLASVGDDSRREYEANRRGIAPAWANKKPKETAAAPQTASASVINPAVVGESLTRAREMGITDDEIAALQALSTATDPSQLDDKTQILYSRAFAKLETASRKEIKRYKFTPEARARLSEANANMLETVSRNMDPDSPLKDDPRMSHIFENPAQINIDASKAEIRYKNALADKAIEDAYSAEEERDLKRRQIRAMEVSAAAEAVAATSPAFKDLASALDASLKRREEEVGNILKNAKTPKEYEKARAEINAILAKDPIYNKEKESWTKLMGEWGKLGVTPVDIALVRRGFFGGLKQEGVQTTIALSPVGGPAAIAAGGSLYNDQAAVDSLEAKYGF
jgi:hypothetical protein